MRRRSSCTACSASRSRVAVSSATSARKRRVCSADSQPNRIPPHQNGQPQSGRTASSTAAGVATASSPAASRTRRSGSTRAMKQGAMTSRKYVPSLRSRSASTIGGAYVHATSTAVGSRCHR